MTIKIVNFVYSIHSEWFPFLRIQSFLLINLRAKAVKMAWCKYSDTVAHKDFLLWKDTAHIIKML